MTRYWRRKSRLKIGRVVTLHVGPAPTLFLRGLLVFRNTFLCPIGAGVRSVRQSFSFYSVTPAHRRQVGIFAVCEPNLNVVSLKNQVLVTGKVRRVAIHFPDNEQTVPYVLNPNVAVPLHRAVST